MDLFLLVAPLEFCLAPVVLDGQCPIGVAGVALSLPTALQCAQVLSLWLPLGMKPWKPAAAIQTPNTRALLNRTPTKRTPNLLKQP